MRISLTIDSATPDEAARFVRAFQRTRHFGLPAQIGTEPTVTIMGIGWGVTTPGMDAERAAAMMQDFEAGNAGTARRCSNPRCTACCNAEGNAHDVTFHTPDTHPAR